MNIIKLACIPVLLIFAAFVAHAQSDQWQAVEAIFGRKGTIQGDVYKVAFPRTDLRVSVGALAVEPALALTSWIAFRGTGNHVMIMGDLVLLDAEVQPVISALVSGDIHVSAIHNHIVGESPAIKYIHFAAEGKSGELAAKMKAVLAVTATPLGPLPAPKQLESPDWSRVESILGRTGVRKGHVLQVGIPRAESITDEGMEIPPFMGMSTAMNFQAFGDSSAVTGDFILLAPEVNPVVASLTHSGIAVTALHNHMIFESPRLFFLHFWAIGPSDQLARGLKAALNLTNADSK